MDTDFSPVVFDLSEFRNQLWAFYGRCRTWRAVANLDKFKALRAVSKAPHALLLKLAKEPAYYPTDAEICRALGIPAFVSIPACSECGKGHWHKHGQKTFDPVTQTVKPLSKPSKPRAKRNAISTVNMDSAFATIVNNIAFDNLVYLRDQLGLYVDAIDNQPAPVLHGQNGAGKGA